ncbi:MULTISPECIES: hypothetical protein [unclassified Ensifer]|uniref:hypothetical protein n=1 Tax=unclassified Ensifer TaxID=2633371 RepID=UPI000813B28E|nr:MULTISPECIES: hypothetical protein [unclassified Ensifer]OCP04404.1 hypothetical protein BBX50_25505 [Ensifer sp. LC11]OCP04684.1 hypothetical protein BC374_25525 [Ensifer sp. LC13]OCP13319.1 hypothetical protein BC362_05335 [Ensifer sp. LC14]OCP30508.1 hypothetical protein BC364_25540 [Ensifer sp. LC499]
MLQTMSKVLVATMIAASALTALPSVSTAQSLDLYIGPGQGYEGDYRRERRYDDDDYYQERRGCSPRQAIRRAYRYGMRDPAIAAMTRNRVIVEGIGRRGEYTRLYLANRNGCPRIG